MDQSGGITCIPPHLRHDVFQPRHPTCFTRHHTPPTTPTSSPSDSQRPFSQAQYGTPSTPMPNEKSEWNPIQPYTCPYTEDVEKGQFNPGTSLPSRSRDWQYKQLLRFLQVIILCILALIVTSWTQTSITLSSLHTLNPFSISSNSHVHALSPDFVETCHNLLTPTPSTYISRLDQLVSVLSSATFPSGRSASWIAEPGSSLSYYIGAFSSSDWWLSERPFLVAITPTLGDGITIQAKPNITILTPAFEASRAHLITLPEEIKPFVTWLEWAESDDPYETLLSHIESISGAIVIEPQVRFMVFAGLQKYAESSKMDQKLEIMSTGPITDKVALIRERKDAREIGLLKCANQMTVHAIRKTRSRMKIGITESETKKILAEEMKSMGLDDSEALVLFGENAALPHGSGTDRVLGPNDLALIDAGGLWGGYRADVTRTFALPKSTIPREHLYIWETVRQAQLAPSQLIKTRPQLSDLDVEARRVISKGLSLQKFFPTLLNTQGAQLDQPDYSMFTHRLGHGIGLDGHESPYVVQGPLGARPVTAGYVISQEPGVYIPTKENRGEIGIGVRLEDCLVIIETEDGELDYEWLSGPVTGWGDI